jgi:Mg-chelatase subunit ChlD
MRLDFCSTMDGNLTKSDRQPIDIAFVVDVSGSMSSGLPDDADRRSKLSVAQDCMRKISDELKPCDRVGLVAFNTAPMVRFRLARASATNINSLKTAIGQLTAGGGTALAAGLKGGYDLMFDAQDATDTEFRMRRVVFLTDMESDADDESQVIALAQRHATVPVLQHLDAADPGAYFH